MQTRFSPAQRERPDIQDADEILRRCVHCGLCTATCPTYVLRGDELDSPRGRIYLIKDMLEQEQEQDQKQGASSLFIKHMDRCLSCLSCMTTCPSGVDYMHLIDMARERIEDQAKRPWTDRVFRAVLALVIPRPVLFRLALMGAWFLRPLGKLLPKRLGNMIAMTPDTLPVPSPFDRPQSHPARTAPRKKAALLTGCAQQVLAPSINEATIRILCRHGCEVVVPAGTGCCGALVHHMGKSESARDQAKRNIVAWEKIEGLDAIVVNASGCGTMLKDYGHLFRDDPHWAHRAQRIAAMTMDITEILTDLGLNLSDRNPSDLSRDLTVACHAACSLQHGQKIVQAPPNLLQQASFHVQTPPEAHLCCGSAGTYNLTQPELAAQLGRRKAHNLASTNADIIATGNMGCQMQIERYTRLPVVHTVELLDWATGGPKPARLDSCSPP